MKFSFIQFIYSHTNNVCLNFYEKILINMEDIGTQNEPFFLKIFFQDNSEINKCISKDKSEFFFSNFFFHYLDRNYSNPTMFSFFFQVLQIKNKNNQKSNFFLSNIFCFELLFSNYPSFDDNEIVHK